jgi:hypothetical protein
MSYTIYDNSCSVNYIYRAIQRLFNKKEFNWWVHNAKK